MKCTGAINQNYLVIQIISLWEFSCLEQNGLAHYSVKLWFGTMTVSVLISKYLPFINIHVDGVSSRRDCAELKLLWLQVSQLWL